MNVEQIAYPFGFVVRTSLVDLSTYSQLTMPNHYPTIPSRFSQPSTTTSHRPICLSSAHTFYQRSCMGFRNLPVAHQRIHPMVTSTKAPQLHLLTILDLFGVAIAPFNRYIGIGVGVHQHIEGAIAIELR